MDFRAQLSWNYKMEPEVHFHISKKSIKHVSKPQKIGNDPACINGNSNTALPTIFRNGNNNSLPLAFRN